MSDTAVKFANTEIRAALDELAPLPTPVSDWLVEIGTDSTDEPAVWVWAVLPDDRTDLDTRLGIRDRVSDFIRERSEIPVQVYVSFRTAAETGGQVHPEIPAHQRRSCTRRTFTAVIERCPDTGFHIRYVPGLAGAHAQGETLDELNANLVEVLALILADGETAFETEFAGILMVRV